MEIPEMTKPLRKSFLAAPLTEFNQEQIVHVVSKGVKGRGRRGRRPLTFLYEMIHYSSYFDV